jgi:hypothetical protein
MHPEKYLDHVKPQIPAVPAIPDVKHYRRIADGTLGEFDVRVMLEQYATKEQAKSLAPHTTGGNYQVVEGKRDKHALLAFALNWDDADAARQFLGAYRKALSAKAGDCEFTTDSAMQFDGHNGQGFFHVLVNENRFESLEGLPSQVH